MVAEKTLHSGQKISKCLLLSIFQQRRKLHYSQRDIFQDFNPLWYIPCLELRVLVKPLGFLFLLPCTILWSHIIISQEKKCISEVIDTEKIRSFHGDGLTFNHVSDLHSAPRLQLLVVRKCKDLKWGRVEESSNSIQRALSRPEL